MPSLWKENKDRERGISMGKIKSTNYKDVTFEDLYNAFLIYQEILERFERGSVDHGSYFIGYAVITSLICEIGLKALLKEEGKEERREHRLDVLFNKLTNERQQEIANHFHISIDDLKKELSKNNDHFVSWRYFYEGNCEKFDIFLINNLIKILNKELDKISKTVVKPEA